MRLGFYSLRPKSTIQNIFVLGWDGLGGGVPIMFSSVVLGTELGDLLFRPSS